MLKLVKLTPYIGFTALFSAALTHSIDQKIGYTGEDIASAYQCGIIKSHQNRGQAADSLDLDSGCKQLLGGVPRDVSARECFAINNNRSDSERMVYNPAIEAAVDDCFRDLEKRYRHE